MTPLDALAFGAHPDDIELSCAGTLLKLVAKGYDIGMVSLTKGELGTRGSVEIRAQEFAAAAGIIGATVHRMLDLPEGNLIGSWEQKIEIVREIRRWQPRLVFAPYWEDRHPDHTGAARLVTEAAFFSGLQKIETGQESHFPFRVLYYPCRYEFQPSFVVDISDFHEHKLKAIQAYKSQFDNPDKSDFGDVETNVSRRGFLEAVITRAKQYGSYIGVEYGEPYLVREPLRLDDPVEFFGPEYLDSFL
jgi:bacillithiol biosynthesis deacetylase BshB1